MSRYESLEGSWSGLFDFKLINQWQQQEYKTKAKNDGWPGRKCLGMKIITNLWPEYGNKKTVWPKIMAKVWPKNYGWPGQGGSVSV